MARIKLKRINQRIQAMDYYIFVLSFWYFTEMLLQARFDTFIGIPKAYLNMFSSYLVLFLLLIKIVCFQRYSNLEPISIVLFGMLVVIVTVRANFNNSLLSFAMFAVASKNVNFDRIILRIYHICMILIPTIILLSFLGVFENRVTYRIGISGSFTRQSLGFNHANTLGMYVFILISCHFYLRFQKLKYWDYLLALAAAYFCYAVPNSKSAVTLLILLPVITLIYKMGRKVSRGSLILYSFLIGAFACNAISIILSNLDLHKYPLLSLIDMAISSRFSICHHDIDVYGITWFGQEVKVIGTEVFSQLGISQANVVVTLDNSYCTILLTYGIVMFAVFSVLYLYNMFLQIKKQRAAVVIFLFLTAVYGVTERTMLTLSINVFLLSFSDVFYCHLGKRPAIVGTKRRKEQKLSYLFNA